VDSVTSVVQSSTNFPLASSTDIDTMADFLDTVSASQSVAIAARDVPISRVIFFEYDFNSNCGDNDANFKVICDIGRGTIQMIPYTS
jgi:peptide deformylase